MKSVIFACLVASLFNSLVTAQDLGNSRELPVKNTPIVPYEPPAVPKQGGDTIADATVIPSLPFTDTGTTAGYIDDYDEVCPYTESTSPDVVYSFTPVGNATVHIDLCGSAYDTKLYVYDSDLAVVGCNDDFYYGGDCGIYVSAIEQLQLFAGMTYFIVVDGYGGEFGDYLLTIDEFCCDCEVPCPADAVVEGEPPLQDGYDDQYNSGCAGESLLLQPIDWTNDEDGLPPYDGHAWLCGQSGWYLSADGVEFRDTDWFQVFALETGVMECTFEAEEPCYLFKLAPTDCAIVAVELDVVADCGVPVTLSFPVSAGEEIWLWVGPTDFTGPVNEFTYLLTVSNNTFDVVPNEGMSWGRVKSLYR